jgi:two-component system, cell cycle sensor histidine kinase and response regulator CckA
MAAGSAADFTTEQLKGVLELLDVGVIITDADGRFRVFNRTAERMMGSGAREVSPDEWAETYGVFHPDRTTPYAVPDYPVMRALKGETVLRQEMFIRNRNVPDGSPIHVSAAPIHDNGGSIVGAVATISDISPLKQAEGRLDDVGRQLLQAQKMEAVGRLAGGVAHEFNNQLSVMLSSALLALDHLAEDSSEREYLTQIVDAGQRAASLTRQLLAMSRRQVAMPRVIVADDVVEDALKVLRRVIGEDVELKVNLGSDDACILMDPLHFEQVLMNLAINARDALPEGGMIVIESRPVTLDDAYAHGHIEVAPGAYYCLTLTDTGHGMDSDTINRVFEPFFTTKPDGKGTGLGMSVVHGIVRQASGHIFVYSEPGKGTAFKIYFPRVDHQPQPATAAPTRGEVDGTGRVVLLVEDDGHVRTTARRILNHQGFEVIEAANAEEARGIATTADRHIDVLVSDVVMPGQSGPELALQLSTLLPGLRVVLMSGYPADTLGHRQAAVARTAFLNKPFTPASLTEAVASVLAPHRDTGEVDKSLGHVLVVEDEEPLRKLMLRAIEARGYKVAGAGSVAQAMAAFDSDELDVVISDIRLPDGNGLELLKQIRHRDMDIPVILMTGAPDVEKATEAIRYGAFRLMTKPVPNDELAEVIAYAVRLGRLSRIKRDALNLVGRDPRRQSDRAGLELCFENALANLWVEFQPIVDGARSRPMAYEVLMRNGEPALRSPVALLNAGASLGRLSELGRGVRERAASAMVEVPEGVDLFVNLHATDLEDDNLYDPDAPLSKVARRVVLELTEREALEPGANLDRRIRKLRGLGYRIAVDDLGAGYSGLASFAQLAPEIVKLDMSLVRDIDSAVAKQRTVGAMVELCHGMDIKVVAEGVETPAERDVLVRLGCDYLQGYHFGRPARQFQ